MQYLPLDHPFWTADCRGPALSHKHGDHIGATGGHSDCPCRDCGLTPSRWDAMVRPTDTLQLPQQGEPDYVPPEPRLTWELRPNRHKVWSPVLLDYVLGPENGPGRGDLSPAWVEWALNHPWPFGGA